jgi:hypothetical protein
VLRLPELTGKQGIESQSSEVPYGDHLRILEDASVLSDSFAHVASYLHAALVLRRVCPIAASDRPLYIKKLETKILLQRYMEDQEKYSCGSQLQRALDPDMRWLR